MTSKFRALFDVQDMTTGSPMRNIVQFSVPLLIGNLAQQLYSTVDSIVVGRYVGDTALAAVGASGPVINLLIVLFVGISTGAGIMVSQYFGAKQKEHLSTTVGNCVTLTLISALIIMALGALITRPLMSLLHTPAEIYDMACDYMTIIFVGILGSAYYNIFSGILRGLGDSVTPLIFLLIACALNTVLDIWFVAGLRMGVAGAAWATILAQFVSGGLCLIRLLMMRKVVQINRKTLHLHKFYAVQLAKLGLPSGITQAIFSLAMIVVQSLTNSMGTAVIACTTVVMRVDGFAMMPNFTFGTAMTTYAGQNMGAGLLDRTRKGTRDGLWHRHGGDAGALGRNARRRRYHDPDVDFAVHNGYSPRAGRLCLGIPHPFAGAAQRFLRCALLLAPDLLGHGRRGHDLLLPARQMAHQGHHRQRSQERRSLIVFHLHLPKGRKRLIASSAPLVNQKTTR